MNCDKTTSIPVRRASAPSHLKSRRNNSYATTAQSICSKSTSIDDQRFHRPSQPSRPSTAPSFALSDRFKSTSRNRKTSFLLKNDFSKKQNVGRQRRHTNLTISRSRDRSDNYKSSSIIEKLSRATDSTVKSTNDRSHLQDFEVQSKGDNDRLFKSFTTMSGKRQSEIEATYRSALLLEQKGQVASAFEAYRHVQKLSGGRHAFGHYSMGILFMRLDKVPEALDCFSRAIAITERRNLIDSFGPKSYLLYQQRAAAYRKVGQYEKAAHDYVCSQKCAEGGICTDDNILCVVETSYRDRNRGGTFVSENYKADAFENDQLTAWTFQLSQVIARVPTAERKEGDVQQLSDFMQKQFAACAALHPEVCNLLCRKLELSPEGALPAQTPLFLEPEEDNDLAVRDCTIYFIFQGRVSLSKTVNRMFQSPRNSSKEVVIEISEQETTWKSPWTRQQRPVSTVWQQSQLGLCTLKHGEIFGHQGRCTNALRTYSAVTATTCVIGALSWHEWDQVIRAQHEIEREATARFLTKVPAFASIPMSDIRKLAYRATAFKIIGSKVVVCEGQPLDGLLVVKYGELCQFTPCGLRSPPDMSSSFALCGRLSEPHKSLSFFTQLETAGDPLSFVHVNDTYHGFLPQTFMNLKQRELLRLASAGVKKAANQKSSIVMNDLESKKNKGVPEPVALALRRGDCFCVSLTWVPSRASRESNQLIGALGAKATLISSATAELLFLSATDLMQELSVESRKLLRRNLQLIAVTKKRECAMDLSPKGTLRSQQKGKGGSNLLQQLIVETKWDSYKEELVKSVLHRRT
ncbi:putative cyclic nucleotide-binding domain, tetratricopeptide-like helical domain superfamily [Plasmopara halstedii]